jgi:hypothetical protein
MDEQSGPGGQVLRLFQTRACAGALDDQRRLPAGVSTRGCRVALPPRKAEICLAC